MALETPAPESSTGVFRGSPWPVLVFGLLSGCVVVATGRVSWSATASVQQAWVMVMAVSVVWVALAVGAVSAGQQSRWRGWILGGAVLDGVALGWLVLWARPMGEVEWSFLSMGRGYLVLASVGVSLLLAVTSWRSWRSRAAAAILCAAVFAVTIASPVWIGGWIAGDSSALAAEKATWAVRVNPFYALCEASADEGAFQWHSWGRMYEWSRLGQYVSPAPVAWWETACLWLLAGGAVGCIGWVSGRRRGSAKIKDEVGQP